MELAVFDSVGKLKSQIFQFQAYNGENKVITFFSGHRFFIFCFTDFFRDKLVSEDEIKIKIKFIRTIFQLN